MLTYDIAQSIKTGTGYGELYNPTTNQWSSISPADGTARGVLPVLGERHIAIQEYGRPNLEMNLALQKLGAPVIPIAIYRWELPDDIEPLRAAARRLAARKCDVVLFTSFDSTRPPVRNRQRLRH